MDNEVSKKSIIIIITVIAVILITAGYFIDTDILKPTFFDKMLRKIAISQTISPKRLFVKTWRISRNSYIDKTMNNQDWARWRLRYFKKIKTMDDANVAINSMLASLNDPYTKFLLSDGFNKQMLMLDSKIIGIGIMVNKTEKGVIINHIMDNSPAQAANFIAGDTIVSVNGENAAAKDIDKLIASIESGKVKKVQLTVKRNNQLITKELSAKDIPIKTMNYKITKDNIGIITLSNILGNKSINDFKSILKDTNNTKGLIIDLRNNYGGIFINALQMANYMLDVDKIVSIESRVNRRYQIYSADEKIFTNKPIVILINKKTASAAEILAGTLKDNLNAILIGENSFGKNTIQQIIPLANKTGLIITTDKYLLPSGDDIYKKGLKPEIEIQNTNKDVQLETGEKLLNSIVKNKK